MTIILKTCIGLALAAATIAPATAGVVVNFGESGSDVIATASGTLDLTGLLDDDTFFLTPGVRGAPAYVGFGPLDNFATNARGYFGVTGPETIGTGALIAPTSVSGDVFGVNAFIFGDLFVGLDYTSGDAIAATATFAGQTIATLGLTPGQYVFSWPADTITVNIGATAAVPEAGTWAMMIGGLGLVGGALRRRTTVRFA